MASVEIPSTAEVTELIVARVEAQTGRLLPKSFVRVLAKALAGLFVLLYKYIGFVLLQMFAAHASWRETTVNGRKIRPLIELGRQLGVGDPRPPVRCEAVVTASVTRQEGLLPGGAQLVNNTTGVLYTVVAPVDLTVGPQVLAAIRSSLDGAGEIGNLAQGDILSFASPLPNVSRDVTVTAVTTAGADGEGEDSYRARVVRRRQTPPQGGAYADYRLWGEELPEVRAVYPYTSSVPGEIDIYVEATPAHAQDGLPGFELLDRVRAGVRSSGRGASGLPNRRPVLAAINVKAVTLKTFGVAVTGLTSPDRARVEEAISEAVGTFLRTREPFIVGLSALPRTDRFTAADISGTVAATAAAFGGSVSSAELSLEGNPIQSYLLGTGELARLAPGGVTYL